MSSTARPTPRRRWRRLVRSPHRPPCPRRNTSSQFGGALVVAMVAPSSTPSPDPAGRPPSFSMATAPGRSYRSSPRSSASPPPSSPPARPPPPTRNLSRTAQDAPRAPHNDVLPRRRQAVSERRLWGTPPRLQRGLHLVLEQTVSLTKPGAASPHEPMSGVETLSTLVVRGHMKPDEPSRLLASPLQDLGDESVCDAATSSRGPYPHGEQMNHVRLSFVLCSDGHPLSAAFVLPHERRVALRS